MAVTFFNWIKTTLSNIAGADVADADEFVMVDQDGDGASPPGPASKAITGAELRKFVSPVDFIGAVDANNDLTVEITFDATLYEMVEVVVANLIPATDAVLLRLRTSSDGGVSHDSGASDYTRNVLRRDQADTSDTLSTEGADNDSIFLTHNGTVGSAAGEDGWSGTIKIIGPNLAKRTAILVEGHYTDSDGNPAFITGSFQRNAAEDVNGFQLSFGSGNAESGTVVAWGYRRLS